MEHNDDDLRQRLAEVEERIERAGIRFTAGYGSDADRESWLAWLQQLEVKRAELRAALARTDPPEG